MINYSNKSFDELVDWVRRGEHSKSMNFGQAIEHLKRGAKITRATIKKFNYWVALAPDGKLHTYEKDDEADTVRDYGYVDLQGEDFFAEDWEVVDEDFQRNLCLPKWIEAEQWIRKIDCEDTLRRIVSRKGSVVTLDNGLLQYFESADCIAREYIPVRFRPYTYEEATNLLGKVMKYRDVCTSITHAILICRASRDEYSDTVFIHSYPLEDWQDLGATIDGVPIGVPVVDEEKMKGGEE